MAYRVDGHLFRLSQTVHCQALLPFQLYNRIIVAFHDLSKRRFFELDNSRTILSICLNWPSLVGIFDGRGCLAAKPSTAGKGPT